MFEDSSSEEDEKPTVTTAPAAVKPTVNDDDDEDDGKDKSADVSKKDVEDGSEKKKSSKINDDDDDDDDDDEKTKDAEKKKTAAPATAGLFDDSSDDDDDDDDDDAVFDDAGAIVGSSAPLSERKVSGRRGGGLDDMDEDDGDDDGAEDNKKDSYKSRSANRPPQNATVLETDRPEPGISLHMAKLPNVVAIQPTAFDEADYDEKEEEEQYMGYMHNMVRWRYKRDENGGLVRDGDGSLVRESNTKLVKWSDGSFTMHIGKESFGIENVNTSTSDGFAGLNGYVYKSQKATFRNNEEDEKDGKEESKQNGGTVLECIGPIASRFVTKPSSLQSEAHKSLTVAVRQRTIKKAKIAAYMTEEDPERLKEERIRYTDDAEKLKQRKRVTGSSGGGRGRNPGMNRRYLEASDDEGYDTVNIKALKRGSKYDDDAMDDYGDDSDDDYGQSYVNRSRNRRQKKPVQEDSEDDEEEMVFDEDDDEEQVTVHKKKKQSNAALLDDDDE
jgi:RNA polymerase-associated protein LEO1